MLSNPKDTKIVIIGDGSWGTTLALHFAAKGLRSVIWGAFPEVLAQTKAARENKKFLPGFKLPGKIGFEADIERAVSSADFGVLAVPSQYLRSVVRKVPAGLAKKLGWLSVIKGIENGSLALMSDVIAEEWGRVPYAVLSGPTIAREVASGQPTAVTVASKDKSLRSFTRKLVDSETFAAYESDDVIGAELGGAVKNVIAIAAGILDGLGAGTNAKSILLARGAAEIARLGTKMGARRDTFMGLSCLGDLATTSFSVLSRNHGCGERIGKGERLASILKSTSMIIEGVDTSKSTFRLARKHKIKMPIAEAVHGVLFSKQHPRTVIRALMDKKIIKETD